MATGGRRKGKVKRGRYNPEPGEKHYVRSLDGRWYAVEHGTRRRVRDDEEIAELEARAKESEQTSPTQGER